MAAAFTRENALARLVEERAPEVITAAIEQSVAMRMFQRVNIGTNKTKFTFLDTLPKAQWLVPNTDEMQTKPPIGNLNYGSVEVGVEEIAGTAFIAENVLDDSQFDIWAEVRARVSEAIGQLIDATIFFGVSPYGDAVPASFPTGGLVGLATAGGRTAVAYDADDFFVSLNAAMAQVENQGYTPDHAFGGNTIRPLLRIMRDLNGNSLFGIDPASGGTVSQVWGLALEILNRRIWDATEGSLLVGDTSTTRIVMRQDLQVKMLDQATIQGVNLAEKDAIGMRFKMRLGWTVLPSATRFDGSTDDFPYALVGPAA